ncbi:MAG: hypothetical protein JOZ38_10975, partial [Candidatus Eremiobacteraeota bacterium]|nr:hypothetical protein [Candidatus Eremiobacteraeota bacterium]
METIDKATTQLLIGGSWSDASDAQTYADRNPATGATIADVVSATH